jgi:hypothetical protein
MSTDSTTSSKVRGIEMRAPYRTRVRTSRPSSSVPNQWPPLGEARRGNFWASGSYGAISGAATTMISQPATMTTPATASGLRHASGRRRIT